MTQPDLSKMEGCECTREHCTTHPDRHIVAAAGYCAECWRQVCAESRRLKRLEGVVREAYRLLSNLHPERHSAAAATDRAFAHKALDELRRVVKAAPDEEQPRVS